ncbi:MAG TPA: glycosyltransferase family 39 protein [Aggregatilineales bacterium]|nr:glycosyltransferase family 39 protein [Aggregatilineales bacterium]
MIKSRSLDNRFFGDLSILILLALVVVVLHSLTNGQYGFHRDELDTLDNARFLAWGYVAYPPMTPFLGRIGLELFGTSLVGIRFFAALAQGIVVVLVGLMARGLGGNRAAQIVAAVAVAISPVALTGGLMLHYLAFDYLWWVLTATCLVYLLKTENPRWWLGIGIGIGLGMMTKYTMAFFVAGIVGGIVLTRARRYLLSPWLWTGVALSLLIFLPNLVWQVQHNFISLDFLNSIHQRDILWGRTSNYLVEQLYSSANPFTIPLWVVGLYFYFIAPAGQRFRPLGWAFAIGFLLLAVTRGRFYYIAPAYPMLIAAGMVWGECWLAAQRSGLRRAVQAAVGVGLLAGGVLAVPLSLPVVPLNSPTWKIANSVNDNFREMIGWPEMVQTVAGVYQKLSPEEQQHTGILTTNYGEAGAINLYGPAYGLPQAISGADSGWYRGYGDPAPQNVIVVGGVQAYISGLFQSCDAAGQVTNVYGIQNEETFRPTILVCRGIRRPWSAVWADFKSFQ